MEINGHKIEPYADLQGADLRRANLQDADLQGADLRRANLQGADLRRADLPGADLQGADLRRANLQGADLRRADLPGADLRRANLWGCIGNGREITTIQTARYVVVYTRDVIQIGCENHPIAVWTGFTDEEIAAMDPPHSLKWWCKWKPILQAILEC